MVNFVELTVFSIILNIIVISLIFSFRNIVFRIIAVLFEKAEVWRINHGACMYGNWQKANGGNNASHANNRTKRRFLPNLQNRKFWVESENRWVSMRTSHALYVLSTNI